MPKYASELHGALLFSTKAHAEIISIDTSAALAFPGVHAYICHTDVPGSNHIGPIFHDEEVFASKTVVCAGAVIGMIVAETTVCRILSLSCVLLILG